MRLRVSAAALLGGTFLAVLGPAGLATPAATADPLVTIGSAAVLGDQLYLANNYGDYDGDFVIADAGSEYVITSGDGFRLNVVAPCYEQVSEDSVQSVRCPKAGVTNYEVELYLGDDSLDVSDLDIPGTIFGGVGDDYLVGGTGDEFISGGPGVDTISYEDRVGGGPAGVVVTLDGVANDGMGHFPFAPFVCGNGVECDDVRVDVENVHTGATNDYVEGSFRSNEIRTGAGNDWVALGHGVLADTADGGEGVDRIDYRLSEQWVSVTFDGVANDGPEGRGDTLNGFEDAQGSNVSGDRLVGDAGPNRLTGGAGVDTIEGGGGDDVLDGGGDGGTLDGGAGDDLMSAAISNLGTDFSGGPGTDWVSYTESNAVRVTINNSKNDGSIAGIEGGGKQTDNVRTDVENVAGSTQDDHITGSTGANVLNGGGGDDVVNGAGGGDVLQAGYPAWASFQSIDDGDDTYSGGAGLDLVDYSAVAGPVTVTVNSRPGDGKAGESDNVKTDVENVAGTDGADQLIGSSASNFLDGRGGDDDLLGGGGNDLLEGGPGADDLQGGTGTDIVTYSSRSTAVTVSLDGAANDGASGSEGDNAHTDVEYVIGGAGDDVITGSTANNTLDGGAGDDVISGGAGADKIYLGPGDDTYDAGPTKDGGDQVYGGSGFDTADFHLRFTALTITLNNAGGDGASGEGDNIRSDIERLLAGSAFDKLTASAAGAVLVGNGGNDKLTGGAGDDTILGGFGDDTLVGGAGFDTADGGFGTDSCTGFEALTACEIGAPAP